MNKNNKLMIFPIGGIEEIGSNCTVYFYKEFVLVVDLGISINNIDDLTPYENSRIDIINFLLHEVRKKKLYLLITHCHDDHIGGIKSLPQMIHEFNKSNSDPISVEIIVSTNFNKHIICKKYPDACDYNFKVVGFNNNVVILEEPSIRYTYLQVDHSMPESAGILLNFDNISVFHTGDWRFNRNADKQNLNITCETPIDQLHEVYKGTNSYEAFKAVSNKCDIVVGESTNIAVVKQYCDESLVKKEMEIVFRKAAEKGKTIYVTCFSSQIERIRNIIDVAITLNLKVSSMGKTMSNNLKIASDNGVIKAKYYEYVKQHKTIENLLADTANIKIVSGSQNESSSVLHRIAYLNHKKTEHQLNKRHIVLFSSSVIPTNRKRLDHLQKILVRSNVEIINNEINPKIHCSGHADSNEILNMIRIINPKYIIPVHGNVAGIKKHSDLAKKFTEGKKIISRYCVATLIEKDEKNEITVGSKIIRKDNNRELVEIDYKLYEKNNPVVRERKNIVQGGCIIVSVKDKKITAVGTRLSDLTIKKILRKIEKDGKLHIESLKRIIGNFKGELVFV